MTAEFSGAGGKQRGALLAVTAAAALPFLALSPAVAPSAAAATVAAAAATPTTAAPGPIGETIMTLALYARGEQDPDGLICQGSLTCAPVTYPYLERAAGVSDLQLALSGVVGQPTIVFGYSQGARVVAGWMRTYGTTSTAPSADQLSFVLVGNPGRKYGGSNKPWGKNQMTPDSQYQVIDVARQYDLAADRPDRYQLLAMANAYAGMVQLHGDYKNVDLYSPDNYVWTEGTTTYVFVPTEHLPILQGLRDVGLSDLADKLEGPMRAKIEKAYDRSYLPPTPGWPPSVPTPTPVPSPQPDPTSESSTSATGTSGTSGASESETSVASGTPTTAALRAQTTDSSSTAADVVSARTSSSAVADGESTSAPTPKGSLAQKWTDRRAARLAARAAAKAEKSTAARSDRERDRTSTTSTTATTGGSGSSSSGSAQPD